MGANTSESAEGWVQDSRFGLIRMEQNGNQITRDPSQQDIETIIETTFLKTKTMSMREYERWEKELKRMEKIREVLLLPMSSKVTGKSYCGMNREIEFKFPSYRILLRQEVQNRWKIDKPYTEPEMWNLLYNLVALGQYYERLNEKIGDLHPSNIVFNEEGFLKIIGKVSIPGQTDNFTKICDSQLADVFLAPEEIDYDCFKKYTYPSGANGNTAELFSIGMTLLEAGTLQPSTYIYDKGPYRINFSKLQQNLNLFQVRYSFHLYNLIDNFLSKKPSSRRTCRDIYQILRPYETRILNMEPFNWPGEKRSKTTIDDSLVYSSVNSQGRSNASRRMISSKMISSESSRTPERFKVPNSMKKTCSRVKVYHSSIDQQQQE